MAVPRKLPTRRDQNGIEVAASVNMLIEGHFSKLQFEVWTSEPTEKTVGTLVYSDGSWTASAGLWLYSGSAWVKL